MSKRNKHEESFEDTQVEESSDDSIVDASNFKEPTRQEVDPLEKEEREAAKKSAPAVPSGKYKVLQAMKVDGKTYKIGDDYEGKLYQDLIDAKAIGLKG